MFLPVYVQLAKWGVRLPNRNTWWRGAFEVDGALLDLTVGEHGVQARSSRPIIVEQDGRIEEAYFENQKEFERFIATMSERHPDIRFGETVEKRVSTNLKGLNWNLELGPVVQQLALKLCVAAATLLPNVCAVDLRQAGRVLREPAHDLHPLVSHYSFVVDAVESKRPPLAHVIYVEHRGSQLHGMVQFFGAWQLHCRLNSVTAREGAHGLIAWLDPVDETERFEFVEPIGLSSPPAFYTHDHIATFQVRTIQQFIANAVARGATRPEVKLTVTLPIYRFE